MSDFRADLPAKQVHSRLAKALDQLQRAEQNALLWFAEIMHRDLYRELGYSSIQQYATEALGFTQNKTYQFIRLASALCKLPQLQQSVAKGEIGWTKAREVVKVATPRTQKRWIREAKCSSNRQLEQKVISERKKAQSEKQSNPDQQSLNMPRARVDSACCSATRTRPVPVLEVPVTVTLRFAPEQLARYEALLEKIEKIDRKIGVRGTRGQRSLSREEIHLAALEDHLGAMEDEYRQEGMTACNNGRAAKSVAENEDESKNSSKDTSKDSNKDSGKVMNEDGNDARGKYLPRGQNSTRYQIIIYKCDTCGQGSIRTRHGTREISPAALQAAACDARVQSKQNRATIPPGTRRQVLGRDRHRCRMKGCGQTRFLEVHHLIPRAVGGKNRLANLITLCSSCHRLLHERYLRGESSPERLLTGGITEKE